MHAIVKRRTFLGLASAGSLAGCLSLSSRGSRETTDTSQRDNSTTEDGSEGRRIVVESVDSFPADWPISGSVTAPIASSTEKHPSEVQISLTNETTTNRSIESGRRPVFGNFFSEGEGPRLLLAPPDWDLQSIAAGCWKPERRIKPPDVVDSYQVGANETRSISAEVWTDPEADACLPIGSYRFEHEYHLYDDGNRTTMWGFVLSVESQ
jgi:hypothetical protein